MTKKEVDDLLFTLDICKKELPMNAHPIHYERIDTIKQIIKKQFT